MFHYLDDFLIVAQPDSSQCITKVTASVQQSWSADCGRPSVCLTFLGIELDTRMMVGCLPSAKLTELEGLVRDWLPRKAYKVKGLQSLVGKLQHACKVVHPGRTFFAGLLSC